MAVLNIAAYLPVDGVDVVDAASVSVPMLQIEDAVLAHVTNITTDGYAPDQHATSHILAPVPTAVGVALTNTTVALDVRLNQIMTLIKSMAGTGTGYSDITVPMSLAAINTLLGTASSSIAGAASSVVSRDSNKGTGVMILGVGIAQASGVATLNIANTLTGTGGSTVGTSGVYPMNNTVAADGPAGAGFAGSNLNAYVANTAPGGLGSTTLSALGQAFAAHTSNIYVGVSYAQVYNNGGYAANLATPAGAYGSVFGSSHFFYIRAVTDAVNTPAINEHCAYVCNARYDMTSGQTGRWWTTDFVAHGAIGNLRPSGFSGVSSVLRVFNNTTVGNYNSPLGSGTTPTNFDPTAATFGGASSAPTNQASASFVATTGYGALGTVATDANHHETATTYPVDVAYAAVGSSGSTGSPQSGQGYRVGFLSGATAGNYGGSIPVVSGVYSRIGKGFFSRDHEEQSFYAYDKYPGSTALAFASSYGGGNSIFGTSVLDPRAANALGTVQVGDNYPTATLQASTSQSLFAGPGSPAARGGTLSVYTGALIGTGGTDIRAVSFGMSGNNAGAADTTILNHHFRRNASGTDYTTTSIGITFDANATVYNGMWLTSTGVGIGATNYVPLHTLDVAGTFATSGIVGIGRAAAAGIGMIIGGTPGNPLAGNAQALAVTPQLTPLSATAAYGVNVAITVDTTAGTVTEAASFRTVAISKTGANAIANAYGGIFYAPAAATATTVYAARFDGTNNGANAQVTVVDVTGHLAISQAAVAASSTLGTNVSSVTVTTGSTDQSGVVTVVIAGGASSTAATIATITHATAMRVAPKAISMVPNDSATWALAGNTQLFAPVASYTASTWIIKSGSVGLPIGTYTWTYTVL